MIKRIISVLMLFFLPLLFMPQVKALSTDQQELFNSGVNYFDDNAGTCGTSVSGTTTATTTLTGSDNEAKIYNYFIERGLSPVDAAAIDGNFGQESGWNPDDIGGYLAQWGGSRLTALAALAQKEGKPITDLGAQLDFVWQELNSDYSNVLANLKKATTLEDAVNQFMGPNNLSGQPISVSDPSQRSGGYEDPGIPAGANRLQFAQQALQKYGGITSTSGGAGASCTASTGSLDCTSATGDAKILCEAKKYAGIYYEYAGGHQGLKAFLAGCPDPSNPPNNQPNGGPVNGDPAGLSGNPSPCATDCSGLVSIALDEAFNQDYMWIVSGAAMQGAGATNWKKISINQTQAGDIVTMDEHVEIVDHVSGSNIVTFGSHETGTKTGDVTQPMSAWVAAYHWTGAGSTN